MILRQKKDIYADQVIWREVEKREGEGNLVI
jgi:hypothetical protein